MTEEGFSYSGAEFEALSQADNYYRWICDMFGSALAGRVLEVGAGRGNFSRHLLARPVVRELVLVEPAENLVGGLRGRYDAEPRVQVVDGYFDARDFGKPFDAIVLVNVLEHVEDDGALAQRALECLRPGGSLLLFVPAAPAIFGSLDVAFGHYRRYRAPGLRGLLESTGFEVERLHHVNLPGVLLWFLAGRVFRQKTIRQVPMTLYDRGVIPWLRIVEGIVRPPRGQSLLTVARKPGGHDG